MRRTLVVAAVAIGAVVLLAVVVERDDPLAYPRLRQHGSQEIPGTFGMTLEPPGDAAPALSPEDAIGEVDLPSSHGSAVTLARVEDPIEGVEVGPAWVVVARGVCLRDAKGELVSDARGNDPNGLGCTDATFVVVGVDARSGEIVLNTTGYDETLTWTPNVGGKA